MTSAVAAAAASTIQRGQVKTKTKPKTLAFHFSILLLSITEIIVPLDRSSGFHRLEGNRMPEPELSPRACQCIETGDRIFLDP